MFGNPSSCVRKRAVKMTSKKGFSFNLRPCIPLPTNRLSGPSPSYLRHAAGWQTMSCGLSGPISGDIVILSLIPHIARYFLREVCTPPKWCDTPTLVLSFTQAHLCDTRFCNVSRHNCAILISKSTKELCDTTATSITRYEIFRCWACKHVAPDMHPG